MGSHSIFQRIFSTQGSMISKSRQNLMCTFYWHKGMLLLLIRSKDFFKTLLCLSIIFFPMLQAFTRPELQRNHFTEANLLRFPHCLAAWGQDLPPLMHSCTRHGRMEHLEWRHTSGNHHRSQFWGRKALTVIYELPEPQWRQPVLKTPEGLNDGGDTHKIMGFTLRSSTRSSH